MKLDLHEIFQEGWQWASMFWWGSGSCIPYCDTCKTCLGGGMPCLSASSC